MGNFYDEWLGYWDAEQEERSRARKIIHEEELEWLRTKQDYRAALMCGRENGFVSTGNVTIAEIPKGWNTGKHSHGEEAMFVIEGTGFSVVDDKRYDWDTGSCLFMPYGSIHQHLNLGDKTVRYLSVMALTLERFAGLAKLMQYEEAGETAMGEPKGIEKAESDIHPEYGRIVLRAKDASVSRGKETASKLAKSTDEFTMSLPKEMRTAGAPSGHAYTISFMREPEFGFKAREVQITHIMADMPGKASHKHGHMEALIYVLKGEGHSIVDGEKIPWEKGALLQVQGPQTVHQHCCTGQEDSQLLRIHFGLRSEFFQPLAKRVFPYLYYEHSSHAD